MTDATRPLSGVERAAVLMMLVDDEEAAAILQKLDPEEVRQLGAAMFAVADVSEAEVEAVLDDFAWKARDRSEVRFDPAPKIETVMTKALGADRAGTMLARIMPPQAGGGLDMLAWMEPHDIAEIVEEEHPQIAAVLMANLDPAVAAQVLELLPEAIQPQILRRVARLGPVAPEAIETLRAILSGRASRAAEPVGLQLGGTREAAKIMSSARKAVGDKVLPKLAKLDKGLAREIEEAMFVFDNLLELDDKNLGTLIRAVDGEILTRALKGVGDAVRDRFLACMSARAADGIRDEMESLPPMKLADVMEAQKAMIGIARGLIKDGTIIMAGAGDDEYV